jgi:biopolymer transport protein ExbB/TolQ
MLLDSRIEIESNSLHKLYAGRIQSISKNSILYNYIRRVNSKSKELFDAAIADTVRGSTKGLTELSIFSSTSPFVGLFGTVVGILESFSRLGSQKSVSLSVVAPAISEALVATAVGIFVAIFAYTAHLILKRKAFELNSILKSQSDIFLILEKRDRDIEEN